ncbi:MAG TPA: calcium/sodium antiporter [Egibacteraceae bacterium]
MRDAAFLVGGLVLLTYAADRFVLGATRLSSALHVPAVLIGAVVIGFGTSAPEMVVSALATAEGAQDIAFGNIVGSNIANMLLVLGAAAVVRPVRVRRGVLRRELPLAAAAMGLLAVVTVDRLVTTLDGLLLAAAAVLALGFMTRAGVRDRQAAFELEAEVGELEGGRQPKAGPAALLALAGLVGTLAGAQLLVSGAVGVARAIGVSEAFIGLTVVAVGTSLPELVTAVAAARRGEPDLIVGNVLGSNVFNSLPVAAIAGLLGSQELDPAFGLSLAVMVVAAVAITGLSLRSGNRLSRLEGVALLAGYVVVTVLLY